METNHDHALSYRRASFHVALHRHKKYLLCIFFRLYLNNCRVYTLVRKVEKRNY